MYIPRSVGWSLVSSTFPVCRVLWVFLPVRFAADDSVMSCAREKSEETSTHMHGHARTARPPDRPDERPDERASY